MVTHPVIGSISNTLFNFNSSSQGYIERFPQLEVPSAVLMQQYKSQYAVSLGMCASCCMAADLPNSFGERPRTLSAS